jgi:hypothetical protein
MMRLLAGFSTGVTLAYVHLHSVPSTKLSATQDYVLSYNGMISDKETAKGEEERGRYEVPTRLTKTTSG